LLFFDFQRFSKNFLIFSFVHFLPSFYLSVHFFEFFDKMSTYRSFLEEAFIYGSSLLPTAEPGFENALLRCFEQIKSIEYIKVLMEYLHDFHGFETIGDYPIEDAYNRIVLYAVIITFIKRKPFDCGALFHFIEIVNPRLFVDDTCSQDIHTTLTMSDQVVVNLEDMSFHVCQIKHVNYTFIGVMLLYMFSPTDMLIELVSNKKKNDMNVYYALHAYVRFMCAVQASTMIRKLPLKNLMTFKQKKVCHFCSNLPFHNPGVVEDSAKILDSVLCCEDVEPFPEILKSLRNRDVHELLKKMIMDEACKKRMLDENDIKSRRKAERLFFVEGMSRGIVRGVVGCASLMYSVLSFALSNLK